MVHFFARIEVLFHRNHDRAELVLVIIGNLSKEVVKMPDVALDIDDHFGIVLELGLKDLVPKAKASVPENQHWVHTVCLADSLQDAYCVGHIHFARLGVPNARGVH